MSKNNKPLNAQQSAEKRPVYTFTAAVPGLSVRPAASRPKIGPEIGPDPRNCQAKIMMSKPPSFQGPYGIHFDFTHGFRVVMPGPEAGESFRLLAIDLDANAPLYDLRGLKPGQGISSEKKYFIRYRLEIHRESDDALIFAHDYDCTDKTVVILIPDGGLGDNLAWLPFVEEFRLVHKPGKLICYCGEWFIRLIREQYPEIDFRPVSSPETMNGVYAAYFCAIFPADRKNWRPVDHQNAGMQGSVARLLGLEPAYRKVRLKLDAPRPFPEPYVCISTMATNPAKYWNYPGGWNAIIRWLKGLGYRVLVIDRDHDLTFRNTHYTVPSEAEDFTGFKPLRDRIALLQNAAFFIGLPSGLSWLAWNCNIPVVMISGFTLDGTEFPTPYRITNFNFCHGCWNDSNLFFDMTDPVWCPRHKGTAREIECTRVITPRMVQRTIRRIPGLSAWTGAENEPEY